MDEQIEQMDEHIEPSAKKAKLDIPDNKEPDVVDLDREESTDAKKAKLDVPDNKEPDVIDLDCEESTDVSTCTSGDSVNENTLPLTLEEKYGLKLFLNKGKRLSGMIKQRHTDFVVRECDNEGNLVHLTNLNHIDDAFITSNDVTECPIVDEVVVQKIKEFVGSEDKTQSLTLDADDKYADKDHRKLVHKYIKDSYKQIETDTVFLEDGSRSIKLSFKSNNSNRQQRRPDWLKNVPKYCHFVLYKEGRTTMECINTLANMVHTKAANFGYAGTKDRRAVSIQRACVKNVHSKQLSGLNSKLRNMAVGDFSYKDAGLSLGDLIGNKFTIMIRDLTESNETIEVSCNSLKEKGFINYFGLQRFGTGEVPTHHVGKVLLQAKFEEAINMLLQHDEDMRFEGAAKKVWHESKDAKEALKAVKSWSSIEGKLLDKLSKQTGNSYNYYHVFMALPRNNRLIYLHSYQSFIWNDMVSRRLEEYGNEPCVGDLILNNEKDEHGHSIPSSLTENDILLKTFTIYDIVLPLPGYDVIYPSNKIGQYYEDVLSSDGIDIHNMKNKIKELSLPGAYRNIVVKPKDMSWKVQTYDDYKISLVQTDLEKIKAPEESTNRLLNTLFEGGKHKGLCFEMTLPTSCYATSALREVLLSDSSYHSQVALNENFKAKDKDCHTNTTASK